MTLPKELHSDFLHNGKIPILYGPTACGKTGLAIEWAESALHNHNVKVEIINCDRLAMVREFEIGSAKPTGAERARVVHHLVDILDPMDDFTAKDFVEHANEKISEIQARGAVPMLVGGTGFYLKALLYGMWQLPKTNIAFRQTLECLENRTLYERIEARSKELSTLLKVEDRYRLIRMLEILEEASPEEVLKQLQNKDRKMDPRFSLFFLNRDKDDLDSRIRSRLVQMLDAGWIAETRSLHSRYPSSPHLKSVGYREIVEYIERRLPESQLKERIFISTRQLAKRQITFGRGQFKGDGVRVLLPS